MQLIYLIITNIFLLSTLESSTQEKQLRAADAVPYAGGTAIREDMLCFDRMAKNIRPIEGGLAYSTTGVIPETGHMLQLVFEKVTNENIFFWEDVTKVLRIWVRNSNDPVIKSLDGGVAGFEQILFFARYKLKGVSSFAHINFWVAYICTDTNGEPFEITTVDKKIITKDVKEGKKKCINFQGFANPSNIEMFMCCVTSPDTPFFSNIGISRSPYRKFHKMFEHRRVSGILHGFSAFMLKCLYDYDMRYMITQPLAKMREIILSLFSKDHVYVGIKLELEEGFIVEQLEKHKQQLQQLQQDDGKQRANLEVLIGQYELHESMIISGLDKRLSIIYQGDVIWREKQNDWFPNIIPQSRDGDPYIVLDRDAMVKYFLESFAAI